MSEPTRHSPPLHAPTAEPTPAGETKSVGEPHEPSATPTPDLTKPAVGLSSASSINEPRIRLGPPGYEIQGELGRGGMGIVYRAHDLSLNRDVAVKILQDKYTSSSFAAHRFLEEARITGQLQHPGIPPIHAVGTLPDGRPFLAMKLIKGRTLDEILKDRMSTSRGTLIAAFEQVCQAVAYAHNHGVIHRDLKPQNVMVGAFGEVQVMDWGLAKFRSEMRTASAETSVVSTFYDPRDDTDESSKTRAGSFLGTPAYMSPEQAIGAVERIDERSDVFGLGAVLCTILTGVPPFVGETAEATRLLAAQGKVDVAFVRLDACGAETELIALCKQCLSADQSGRPANAGEVAKAVAELRQAADDRARRAELDRVRAEGEQAKAQTEAREQRKRRKVQVALAGSVAIMAGLSGFAAWWGQKQIDTRDKLEAESSLQRERTRDGVKAAIERASEMREKWLWKQADDALLQANAMLGANGDPTLLTEIEAARKDLKFVERLYQIRLDKAGLDGNYHNDLAPPAYAAAFREYGYDILDGDKDELAGRLKASPVLPDLLAALDDWAWTAMTLSQPSERIWSISAAVTGQGWRTELLPAARDLASILSLLETIPQEQLTPSMISFLASRVDQTNGTRSKVYEAGVRRFPTDFWMHLELGWQYFFAKPPKLDSAIGAFRAAVALKPANPIAHNFLINAFQANGDAYGAMATVRGLLKFDPKSPTLHVAYARMLLGRRDIDGAEAACREALRLNPNEASFNSMLGEILANKKDFAGAVVAHREAVRLDPKGAWLYYHLGIALRERGDSDEAVAALREAIRLDPNVPQFHGWLGGALVKLQDLPAASVAYRAEAAAHQKAGNLVAAIGALQWFLRIDANDPLCLAELGKLLRQKGDLIGAVAALRDAVRLKPDNAAAHSDLGFVLWVQRDLDGAVTSFKEVVRLDPMNAQHHSNLGNVLRNKSDLHGAIACYKEAIRLDPKNARYPSGLGTLLKAKGDLDGAIAAWREAIRLDPKFAFNHNSLGAALHEKGDADGAMIAYREAIQAFPFGHAAYYELWVILRARGELERAIALHKEAVRVNPTYPVFLNNAADSLIKRGELGTALDVIQESIRLDPKLAIAHLTLGEIRMAKGDLNEAIAAFKEALKLGSLYDTAIINLRNAFWKNGDAIGGIAYFRELTRTYPSNTILWVEFGLLQFDVGDHRGAAQAAREAIRINPGYFRSHSVLCIALREMGDFPGSEAAAREALRLAPSSWWPLYDLGMILMAKGDLDGALVSFRETLKRTQNPQDLQHSQNNIRQIERWKELLIRLPDVSAGRAETPTPTEALEFAALCSKPFQRRYVVAVRLCKNAFAADPKLANNLAASHRYNAACFAALAAAGQDVEMTSFGVDEWGHLTDLAHGWLRADLELRAVQANDPKLRPLVRQNLNHWKKEINLIAVRDPAALAAMTEPDRKKWSQLWADVDAVLASMVPPTAPTPREVKR